MSPIYECNSLSEILSTIFDRRRNKNTSYSLRAFARDIQLSPSRLSEVLNGAKGLNADTAHLIATHLKLKPQEKKFFLDTILAYASRNKQVRELAKERIEKLRRSKLLLELQVDQFKIIADWYHPAILELTQLSTFENNYHWIANKLGLTYAQTKTAVERLKKVGLIQILADGQWQVNPDAYQTFSKSSSAVKQFHTEVLEKSLHSVKNDLPNDREMQAMILAIPKSELSNFSAKMRDFLRECWEDINGIPKDELYSFSIQLTPIQNTKVDQNENYT